VVIVAAHIARHLAIEASSYRAASVERFSVVDGDYWTLDIHSVCCC
jgi:hypothetical protein